MKFYVVFVDPETGEETRTDRSFALGDARTEMKALESSGVCCTGLCAVPLHPEDAPPLRFSSARNRSLSGPAKEPRKPNGGQRNSSVFAVQIRKCGTASDDCGFDHYSDRFLEHRALSDVFALHDSRAEWIGNTDGIMHPITDKLDYE